MLGRLRDRFGEGLPRGARVGLAAAGLLGLLALAWVVSGFLIGGTSGQQSSTTPEHTSPDSGGVENLQNSAQEGEQSNGESYSAYQSKDPFRQLVAPATQESANGGGTTGGGKGSRAASGDGTGQSAGGGGDQSSDSGRDGPGRPSDDGAGAARSPDRASPEREATATRDQRGTGGATEGGGGLFDSGGNLPPPQ